MSANPSAGLRWAQVFGWRLRRQLLSPVGDLDAVQVADRLCGVQAQVPTVADLAVAVRTAGRTAGLATPLAGGRLVRTWAARGTLHVLPVPTAARQLALLAAARSWHAASWQRTFAPLEVMTALAAQVHDALDDGPLTREEPVAALGDRIDRADLAEQLRSGWSTLLKPLAWQGILCQGPPRGHVVTFARPDRMLPTWPGRPDPDDAGPVVIRGYLAAFGPSSREAFDAWLIRGATRRADLRRWFAALGTEEVEVEVEGRRGLALAADLDELRAAPTVRGEDHLLPGFDQYVLGSPPSLASSYRLEPSPPRWSGRPA